MSMERIPRRSALAIIGAGPIGLEAAAWAADQGWDFAVFEKGEVAEHLRRWGHVQLFSPFGMNHSRWGLELLRRHDSRYAAPPEDALLSADEHRRRYLLPLAELPQLASRIYCGVRVVEVGKAGLAKKDAIGEAARLDRPFRLLLEHEGKETAHLAHAVIDASGVYSNPQFLGDGNIPAVGERTTRRSAPGRLHYHLVDLLGARRSDFAGKTTLVIGAGHSAATHLEALGRLVREASETRVIWACRKHRQPVYERYPDDPLPYRDQLSRLANRLAESPPDWLRFIPGVQVEALEVAHPDPSRIVVSLRTKTGEEQVEVDQVLASVGFRPDNRVYRQLQVHECYATGGPMKLAGALLGGSSDCLAQESPELELLQNPEPGFFILGNKSYGTNSAFLLSHGIEQVQEVMGALAERFHSSPPAASSVHQ